MKKLIAITGALLTAYVMISASLGGGAGAGAETGDLSESSVIYVMREENGRVVVYANDTVYLRTDTQVSSLPKSDRQKLRDGIAVFSEEELKKLVEDICS